MPSVSNTLKNVLELVVDGPLAINKTKALKRLLQEAPRRNEFEEAHLLHLAHNILINEKMLLEDDIDKMINDLYDEINHD